MWCYISVSSYVTVLLWGLCLTVDNSLRSFGEVRWIHYHLAAWRHFLGLYDRWQTHSLSIPLALPPLIQNFSLAKRKDWKRPTKHSRGYLTFARVEIERRSSSLSECVQPSGSGLSKQGDKYLRHQWTGRGLVVFYSETSTCHHISGFLAKVPNA